MSVQTEINRIIRNVDDTYSALDALGASMPNTQNSDNLPSTVSTIKAVLYMEQSLSVAEKTQARENIGAGTSNFSGSYQDLSEKPTIPSLNNTVTSTSTTQAATANAVKTAYDKAAAAMPKTGGTFTGTVKAGSGYEAAGTMLLRNSKLVSAQEDPTVNGEIVWVYA